MNSRMLKRLSLIPRLPAAVLTLATFAILASCSGNIGNGSRTPSISRPGNLPSGSGLPTLSRTPGIGTPTNEVPTEAPATTAAPTTAPPTETQTPSSKPSKSPTQPPSPTTQPPPTSQPPSTSQPSLSPTTVGPASTSASAAPAEESSGTSPWLWVVLALIAAGIVAFFLLRGRQNPWTALAKSAVTDGEALYERIAADLSRINIEGSVPESLAESQRTLDVLAGRLAELARDPGHINAQPSLATLRQEVDGLRVALQGLGGVQVNLAEALPDASRRLTSYEGAVRAFRDQIEPPAVT